jgi:hypothetical protein
MKKFLVLFCLILIIPLLTGCENTIPESLDTDFTLAPGQTGRILKESFDVQFVDVSQDSRCPTGVECIRAGNFTCDIIIIWKGDVNNIRLTSVEGSDVSTTIFGAYKLYFSLSPRPQANQTINKKDYRLTLKVTNLIPPIFFTPAQ